MTCEYYDATLYLGLASVLSHKTNDLKKFFLYPISLSVRQKNVNAGKYYFHYFCLAKEGCVANLTSGKLAAHNN